MANTDNNRFISLLKKNNLFITKPRLRLFEILQHHPALTLKELINLTTKHDQVTVYRNINLFEKLGIINRIRLGWNTKIELSDIFIHHHHHMSCTKCGKILDLAHNQNIEKEITKISHLMKFKPLDHQLEIRGICLKCQKT